MSYEPFQTVIVPFPFTDRAASKRRPALVLSSAAFGTAVGHSVLAMITSQKNAPWAFDVALVDLASAGLPAPSVVRMKLFTLDHRLIQATIGQLSAEDEEVVTTTLHRLFPWLP